MSWTCAHNFYVLARRRSSFRNDVLGEITCSQWSHVPPLKPGKTSLDLSPPPLPPVLVLLAAKVAVKRYTCVACLRSQLCTHAATELGAPYTTLGSLQGYRSSLTSVWPWILHDVILRRRSRLRLKLSLRRASPAIFWNPAGPSITSSRRITTLWRNLQDCKSLLINRPKRKSDTLAPRALCSLVSVSLSWHAEGLQITCRSQWVPLKPPLSQSCPKPHNNGRASMHRYRALLFSFSEAQISIGSSVAM